MTLAAYPSDREVLTALRTVGGVLDCSSAYQVGGVFFFQIADSWLLGLSADSAGRIRLGARYGRTEVASLWALAGDLERLAALALGLRSEVVALAA